LNATFGSRKLTELSTDIIEGYLRNRLRARVRRKTRRRVIEKGVVKPSTVHQEFRVLRRVLNVVDRKRLLPANPCWGVEFPIAVNGLFRPHYVSCSEQQRLEAVAPASLANVIRIITETGRARSKCKRQRRTLRALNERRMPGPADSDWGAAFPTGRDGVRRALPTENETTRTRQSFHPAPADARDDESRATLSATRIAQFL
jgi:hypothetical protein